MTNCGKKRCWRETRAARKRGKVKFMSAISLRNHTRTGRSAGKVRLTQPSLDILTRKQQQKRASLNLLRVVLRILACGQNMSAVPRHLLVQSRFPHPSFMLLTNPPPDPPPPPVMPGTKAPKLRRISWGNSRFRLRHRRT